MENYYHHSKYFSLPEWDIFNICCLHEPWGSAAATSAWCLALCDTEGTLSLQCVVFCVHTDSSCVCSAFHKCHKHMASRVAARVYLKIYKYFINSKIIIQSTCIVTQSFVFIVQCKKLNCIKKERKVDGTQNSVKLPFSSNDKLKEKELINFQLTFCKKKRRLNKKKHCLHF